MLIVTVFPNVGSQYPPRIPSTTRGEQVFFQSHEGVVGEHSRSQGVCSPTGESGIPDGAVCQFIEIRSLPRRTDTTLPRLKRVSKSFAGPDHHDICRSSS